MRLFTRRERWGLAPAGWALLMALIVGCTVLGGRQLNRFLTLDQPVGAPIMVVEGWLPRYAYREAARRFLEGGYERVVVAGLRDDDYRHSGDGRPDDFGAADLIASGVPRGNVYTAIADNPSRDRTYHAALAVKHALESQRMATASIDVVTLGAHARRSRLVFAKALGGDRRVGVIAIEDRLFDPTHWWRSSEGVRTVLGEAIAYLYARFVFTLPD